MGVVYKARDMRLNRIVALKLLGAATADQTRRERFVREAKAASALNHPNIVSVYDIGDSPDGLFMAMEYVAGETLAAAMGAKPLPIAKTLRYAVDIAGALAAAHAAGIVHRDVKPANLMVTSQKQVKVLDFGIAKLIEPPPGELVTTVTMGMCTGEGKLIGSIAYMSPEQAEGQPVDPRSDIFSFGTVLYEMLTGQRPFRGASSSAVLAAVLREEPVPPSRINSLVPPELERVVARCLEKEPDRRFQHAADLKVALAWLERDLEAGKLGTTTRPNLRPDRKSLAVVLVLVGAGMVFALAMYQVRPSPRSPENPVRITSDLGLTSSPALSADGTLLAYSADRGGDGNLDIWVQQLPAGEPVRRTRDKADDLSPHFSPDAGKIVFERAGAGAYVMPTFAGEEHLVAPGGLSPRFSPDGTQIAYWVGDPDSLKPSGKVYVTALGGGTPRQLAPDLIDARFPLWAPDGKHVLLQGFRALDAGPEWWIAPLDGGPARDSGILSALRRRGLSPLPGPGDWKENHIVFSATAQRSRHLWYATLKPSGWQLSSPAEQLTFGTAAEGDPSLTLAGQVAFSSWNYRNNLWRLALSPPGAPPPRIERLSKTAEFDTCPTISADARTLAFLSRRSGTREIWLRDLQQDSETELTIGPGDKSTPVLTTDGSLVAYSVTENGKPSIYVAPAAGHAAGVPKRACESCGAPSDWVGDHGTILYLAGHPQSVHLLDIESGRSTPILRHPNYDLDQARVSPDGRWIAFVGIIGADRTRIFISQFHSPAAAEPNDWIAVTDGNAWDDKPRWQNSDALIYYSGRDRFGCLWKQRLRPDTRQPVGAPLPVYHFHTLRLSPRTLYRAGFEIAVARDILILNLVEITGNVWRTALPQRR